MRDFCKVNPSLWTSKRFRSLAEEGQRFYLYVLTSPQSNSAGCYRLNNSYACADLAWEKSKFDTVCHTVCESGLLQYDKGEEIIYIDKWFSFNAPANPKHCLKIITELAQIPHVPLRDQAAESLLQFLQTTQWDKAYVLQRLKDFIAYGTDTVSTPYRYTETYTETKTKKERGEISKNDFSSTRTETRRSARLFSGEAFNGQVIDLTPENFNLWFQKYGRGDDEHKFRRLLRGRDEWYAKQPYSIQQKWVYDTTKFLIKNMAGD